MSIQRWDYIHTDLHHPGSRSECDHCQEMIKVLGPMPSINDLAKRDQELTAIYNANQYKKIIIPEELRWEIFERDDFRCVFCGSRKMLRVDHIKPEILGGRLEPSNLQTLCRTCNSRKGRKWQ